MKPPSCSRVCVLASVPFWDNLKAAEIWNTLVQDIYTFALVLIVVVRYQRESPHCVQVSGRLLPRFFSLGVISAQESGKITRPLKTSHQAAWPLWQIGRRGSAYLTTNPYEPTSGLELEHRRKQADAPPTMPPDKVFIICTTRFHSGCFSDLHHSLIQ